MTEPQKKIIMGRVRSKSYYHVLVLTELLSNIFRGSTEDPTVTTSNTQKQEEEYNLIDNDVNLETTSNAENHSAQSKINNPCKINYPELYRTCSGRIITKLVCYMQ